MSSLDDRENFRKADIISSTDDDLNDLAHKLDAAVEAIGVPSVPMKPPYSLKDMDGWAYEILGDGELDPSAKVLARGLSLHINRKDGFAYPGLDLIAEEIKMAKKTIIAAREQLRARGHLLIEPGRPGYKTSAHYWPRRWQTGDTLCGERDISHAKRLSDVDKSPRDVSHAKRLPQGERRFRGGGETFPNRPRDVSHGKHEPLNNPKEPLSENGESFSGALARDGERRSRACSKAETRGESQGYPGYPSGDS